MSAEGRAEIHRLAEDMLRALLHLVQERHGASPLTVPQLRADIEAFARSPAFARLLQDAHGHLIGLAGEELLRQRRGDPFQRLMIHPLTDVFESGQLSRDILPNYFSFLHLVLGDAREDLALHCRDILSALKGSDDLAFSWDSFYDDPRAKQILWTVLVRIAETFRRFDARRDWFIGLMQNRPQAVSLGSHMFQPLPRHEDGSRIIHPFGLEHFHVLFSRLFAPLRRLSASDRRAFETTFGVSPEDAIGHIFANLAG